MTLCKPCIYLSLLGLKLSYVSSVYDTLTGEEEVTLSVHGLYREYFINLIVFNCLMCAIYFLSYIRLRDPTGSLS